MAEKSNGERERADKHKALAFFLVLFVIAAILIIILSKI